jgi:predicted nucleic acid-binding protein
VIVLSDTSPIHYLVLTGQIEILPSLFGDVVIPSAVVAELNQSGTPPIVRDWDFKSAGAVSQKQRHNWIRQSDSVRVKLKRSLWQTN